jgi:hypothetical protein
MGPSIWTAAATVAFWRAARGIVLQQREQHFGIRFGRRWLGCSRFVGKRGRSSNQGGHSRYGPAVE